MKLEFVGNGIEFTDAIKMVVKKKLFRSFSSFDVRDIRIVISKDGSLQKIALYLQKGTGVSVVGSSSDKSLYVAIDRAIAKVRSQVAKGGVKHS
ncbi:HPF/RaiA family ribosome-associated protein [Vibrio owensii]|uniref:HPF/RaiA family ribosome-associated protein n=1 Tax=Vibrio owensii TaxID=696485 RepID=UPI0018F15D24|nr:HPF/RaiA family ribosome-associated protein [Vibrio owensii]